MTKSALKIQIDKLKMVVQANKLLKLILPPEPPQNNFIVKDFVGLCCIQPSSQLINSVRPNFFFFLTKSLFKEVSATEKVIIVHIFIGPHF